MVAGEGKVCCVRQLGRLKEHFQPRILSILKEEFDQIVRDQSHKLHDLLPTRNESNYCTRSQRYFKLPICKTDKFKNTFIMANSFDY